MKLANRETEKTELTNTGFLAQRRLCDGIRLNVPESIALIATQILYYARLGVSVSQLMENGKKWLGKRQVSRGFFVSELILWRYYPNFFHSRITGYAR